MKFLSFLLTLVSLSAFAGNFRLNVTEVRTTSADLQWTPGLAENALYYLHYNAGPQTPSYTIVSVTSPYTLTGLRADTTYFVKISAVTSNGQLSTKVVPFHTKKKP